MATFYLSTFSMIDDKKRREEALRIMYLFQRERKKKGGEIVLFSISIQSVKKFRFVWKGDGFVKRALNAFCHFFHPRESPNAHGKKEFTPPIASSLSRPRLCIVRYCSPRPTSHPSFHFISVWIVFFSIISIGRFPKNVFEISISAEAYLRTRRKPPDVGLRLISERLFVGIEIRLDRGFDETNCRGGRVDESRVAGGREVARRDNGRWRRQKSIGFPTWIPIPWMDF